jgi:hypothetical protein
MQFHIFYLSINHEVGEVYLREGNLLMLLATLINILAPFM